MGDKIQSKILAKEAGVNTIPGFNGVVKDVEHALKIANDIGYPVMLKASSGGGGKGMRIAWNDKEVNENFKVATNEAVSSFGDGRLLVEKFVDNPRHIEIQLIGDKHGNTYYLPERECSIQRRNQKVIEEAPSTHIDQATREAMGRQAVSLAKAVGYHSAGTVEFLVDPQRNFYFLEMNTRLQVEHPITEYVTGLDLVELMIHVAAGEKLDFLDQNQVHKPKGWAVESRVYAEDPEKYLPSIGRLTTYIEPQGGSEIRCDSGIIEGSEISVYYDPMICKLCTYGETRSQALSLMEKALDSYVIKGVTHNIPLLREVISHPRFVSGKISTKFLAEEFPKGFPGHVLTEDERQKLLTMSAWIFAQRDIRNRSWINHDDSDIKIPSKWNLYISTGANNEPTPVTVDLSPDGDFSATIDGKTMDITAAWPIESPLVTAHMDTGTVTMQFLDSLSLGFRLSYMGTKYDISVRTENQAKFSKYMKEKPKMDMNKFVVSPMPGVLVSMAVKVGDVIAEGAEVAVVEAMKMQNVLRATQAGRVKKIHVGDGANVQASDILVEFEDVPSGGKK